MKKFISKAALVMLGAVALSSCSDWLDYEPADKQTEDQQFASRAGFYTAVNGTYNKLATTSLYGKNLSWGAVDLMSKRYQVYSSSTNHYNWSVWKYTENTTQADLSSIWSSAYNAILNANVILSNVDTKGGSVLTATDKAVIKGDMLSLRAMMHLDLLRMFGPEPTTAAAATDLVIPYNTESVAKVYDLLPTAEVIEKVIKDLDEAETLLKSVDPVRTEGRLSTTDDTATDNYLRYRQLRANYYATVLLKARAYLWVGNTQKALVEAKKIVEDPQVQTLFPWVNAATLLGNQTNPDRVFSTEVLFGIYNANRADIFKNNFDASGLNYGAAFLGPRANYLTTYVYPQNQQGDYRYQSQWMNDGGYDVFTKFKAISYNASNPPFYAFLMPLIRVSEAYYIAAECVKNSDPAKAVEYINVVKSARGAIALDPATVTTSSAIMNELIDEYIREFWGEGQIFFFMKRASNNWLYGSDGMLNAMYNGYNTASYYFRNVETQPTLPTVELESR